MWRAVARHSSPFALAPDAVRVCAWTPNAVAHTLLVVVVVVSLGLDRTTTETLRRVHLQLQFQTANLRSVSKRGITHFRADVSVEVLLDECAVVVLEVVGGLARGGRGAVGVGVEVVSVVVELLRVS